MTTSLEPLTSRNCFNHPTRESVARCPECGRFFCRECITEHDDRVICAACLQKKVASKSKRKVHFMPALLNAIHAVFACCLLWLLFYWLGYLLLKVPTAYHEGTLW